MQDSTLQDNSNVGFFGAGGGLSNFGVATITHSTFSGNSAASPGGGISNEIDARLILSRSVLDSNNAAGGGGGIANAGWLTLTNSTVSSNSLYVNPCCTAVLGGGGVLNTGNLWLRYTTLSANTAESEEFEEFDVDGGGILNSGQLRFENTIIAGNTAATHHDCSDTGTMTSLGHNLVGDGTGCPTTGTDLTVVPTDVFSTVLGSQQNNGSPVFSHALLPGSPAIDAAGAGTCPATDQRGYARPVDGDRDGTAACDIGAYERQFEFYFPYVSRDS